MQLKASGYHPTALLRCRTRMLREVIDQIGSGDFSGGEPQLFRPIVDSLLNNDEYMLLADYQAYVDCQDKVSAAYRDQDNGRGCRS